MNAPAAESIERIHPGSHEAPCSMTPIISVGKRSSTPSKIIVASVCIGDSPIAMYDTEVKLPSPPWKSGTSGRPLRLYAGSIGRPPPTWKTIGHAGLLGHRPQRVEADVRRAVLTRAHRRDHQRRGTEVERLTAISMAVGIDANGTQHTGSRRRSTRAEVDDATVVRPRRAER